MPQGWGLSSFLTPGFEPGLSSWDNCILDSHYHFNRTLAQKQIEDGMTVENTSKTDKLSLFYILSV